MNTAQKIIAITYVTLNKRNMMLTIQLIDITMCCKLTVFSWHLCHSHTLNKLFISFPLPSAFCNRQA